MDIHQYFYVSKSPVSVRQLSNEGPRCYYLQRAYWLNEQIESLNPHFTDLPEEEGPFNKFVEITDILPHLAEMCAYRCQDQIEDGDFDYQTATSMTAIAWAQAHVANGWRVFYTVSD